MLTDISTARGRVGSIVLVIMTMTVRAITPKGESTHVTPDLADTGGKGQFADVTLTRALRLLSHSTSRLQDDVYKHIMELGILHNSPPSTKRGCRAGRLHRLWHGLPPAPWPCTRSQHHSVPSRNLHPLMVPPFLQPHPDLQSAVGNAPLSSKHPAQLPTTDCLLSIISPMGGQPSDAPALSPPSPLQQGGQSSNAPALSPPSPLPQGGQPIALALSPPSPPPQGGQPSDAPGLSPSSSTLLLCPSDSTLNICHLNSQSAVKTGHEREREQADPSLKKHIVMGGKPSGRMGADGSF
ncbi:hypothetical protein ACOMHN_018888 [Nucella lapillus]